MNCDLVEIIMENKKHIARDLQVDKGFELMYYKLSYRRRFIRTLWLIPWMILVLFLLSWIGATAYILVPVAILFVVVGFIQALYNYRKWKKADEDSSK